ncbi:MAG: AraC family transcriptional regulator [Streptococcaceae bacterium]|jgi:AraC-like DNA-binding protein|nr:AraC family transcriptional regulator [Streptococcaceae bacterium]
MNHNLILFQKLCNFFESKADVPFAKVACYEENFIRYFFQNKLIKESWSFLDEYTQAQRLEKAAVEMLEITQEYFTFFNEKNYIYVLKPVHLMRGYSAILIFGGYLLNKHDISNTLPKLSSIEIKKIFSNINKEINKLIIFNSQINQIIELVHSDLSKSFTVLEISERIFCSERKIHYLFKEHLGETFGDYCRKLKLNWAIDKSKEKNIPIGSLALSIGYKNQSSLYRALKRHKASF